MGEKNILEIVAKMCELANTARKEGLYALEEEIPDIEHIFHGKYLKYMIQLILNGTDPELMEELIITRYFSANLTGHEALHYLVMLVGCLKMQAMEDPKVTEEILWAMIPEKIAENHYKEKEEQQGTNFDIVEQYYDGEARHHIFDNLSSRLAVMVAEDMERMGHVEMKTIVSSINEILGMMVKLVGSNEVICTDDEALCLLADFV